MSSGDVAEVGITDYAQQQLGDVVFVELPDVGRRVDAGETFGSVESVKAVSELFAPMSGEVIEVNPRAERSPRDGQHQAARDMDGADASSDPSASESLLDSGRTRIYLSLTMHPTRMRRR